MDFFSFDPFNLFSTALVILGIQIVFFVFAAVFKTDKVTDLSYSLTFILITLLLFFSRSDVSFVPSIITVLIAVWGCRLGGYLFIRILKLKKDKRFDGIRENPISFGAFWIVQAVTVWVIMLPGTIILSLEGPVRSTPFTWFGILLWCIGFLFETIADAQKYRFRNNEKNRDRWIQHGLWRFSRHPNYFGESLCWWSLFLIAVPHLEGWMWVSIIGPIFLMIILLFFSGVPTVEKRAEATYGTNPQFQQYKARTSLFIPLPPKKRI